MREEIMKLVMIALLGFMVLAGCEQQTNADDAKKATALGGEKAMQGEFKEAINLYDKAINVNPNDAYIYFNRGAAKLNLGDFDGAIADFTKTIELNPKLKSPAYKSRAMAKRMKGDEEGAKRDMKIYYDGE
ncbi:MAG: tetratricopeptide repeat protein [Candidatus Thiodiazotropha sp. (ex Lucinoma kastoroae)]|nr:tetratricopeptide repeat protein [Candidatus Thiodiazotropha sp. (ex Lucinoma kastoroae)]